ncbi:LuxR C-terminal-related transcriptional regulator [Streptomyces sp. NPDC021622]|uniref:helix-turn-helix transcriptional regulator n=1 Tax=Streptomyces sp. NPDC021622 TaxID=3155013 RepID=UPI0033E7A97A
MTARVEEAVALPGAKPAGPSAPPPDAAHPVCFGRLRGREAELALLARLLADPEERLITLTGPVGVGKSHLAHTALNAAARPADATVVVDLADARDEASVWAAAGTEPGHDCIGDRDLLLVLDNCDRVAEHIALGISSLLRTCPQLKVLVTSRMSLDIRAERIVPVAPLPTGAGSPAVQLFSDLVRPYYLAGLTGAHGRRTVADICAELDGIPLSIAIAAEAVGTQSPDAILDGLRQGRHSGTHRLRDAPARHRSVESALSWAEETLTADDRRLLCGLSVFEGVFDMAAVRCAGGLGPQEAVGGVESLVHKSLLMSVVSDDGTPRFRLPHIARAHYRAELARNAGEYEQAYEGLIRGCLDFAATTAARLRAGEGRAQLVAEAGERLPDLRAAVARLRSRGDHTRALGLLVHLEEPLLVHGLAPDVADDIEECATQPWAADDDPFLVTEALLSVARWALGRGDTGRADAVLRRAASAAAELPGIRARVKALTGELLRRRGEMTAAAALLESALDELDAAGDLYGAATARRTQSLLRAAQGDPDAETPILRALEDLRTVPEAVPSLWAVPESVSAVQASLLTALARVRRILGRAPQAYEASRDAMRLLLGAGGPGEVAEVLETVATVAGSATAEERHAVARVLADAQALRRRHGLVPDDDAALEAVGGRLREALDAAELHQLRLSAHQISLRDALIAGLFAPRPECGDPAEGQDTGPAPAAAPGGLTARQHQIALLVAEGLTNRQIARRLQISEWTVINHLRVVMQKLDCTSRVHVARAMG